MNIITASLLCLYSKLLLLYPGRFQNEFAEEMQIVFRDSLYEAGSEGILALAFACLREFGELPFNILCEFWYDLESKKMNIVADEHVDARPTATNQLNDWDVILATLPFVLFGITSMIGKSELPLYIGYPYLAFFAISLLGLVIGLVKGFPRWTYIYLGWSVVMSWLWMGMTISTFSYYFSSMDPVQLVGWQSWIPDLITLGSGLLGWLSWIPLLMAIGVGLVLARSLQPLLQLIRGIWQDWTLLSLGLYTFGAYAFMIFDENHHPYLFAFMIAVTLIITGSIWIYMKSTNTGQRVLSLLSGFGASYVVVRLCDATWDWAAYHGLPPSLPEPWYTELVRAVVFFALWSALLFWPVIIGLMHAVINNQQKPKLTA